MTINRVIKYADNKNLVCGCGEELWWDGECTYELPLGFGSHPRQKDFFMDKIRYHGWVSKCLHCHKITLAYTSKRILSYQLPLLSR